MLALVRTGLCRVPFKFHDIDLSGAKFERNGRHRLAAGWPLERRVRHPLCRSQNTAPVFDLEYVIACSDEGAIPILQFVDGRINFSAKLFKTGSRKRKP